MMDNYIDVLINGCGIGGVMFVYLFGCQGYCVVVVEQVWCECVINGVDLFKLVGIWVVEVVGLLVEVICCGGWVCDELEVYYDGELFCYFNYFSVDVCGYFIFMFCELLCCLVLEKIDGEVIVEMLFEICIEVVQCDECYVIDQVCLNDGCVLCLWVVVGVDGIVFYVCCWLFDIDVECCFYLLLMLVGIFVLVFCVVECNCLYVDLQGGLVYFYLIGFDCV